VWDGHSCPSLLTLVLKWQRIPNVDTNTNIKTKIKIKGDGQECPSHKGSYHKKSCALLHVGNVKTSTRDCLH